MLVKYVDKENRQREKMRRKRSPKQEKTEAIEEKIRKI